MPISVFGFLLIVLQQRPVSSKPCLVPRSKQDRNIIRPSYLFRKLTHETILGLATTVFQIPLRPYPEECAGEEVVTFPLGLLQGFRSFQLHKLHECLEGQFLGSRGRVTMMSLSRWPPRVHLASGSLPARLWPGPRSRRERRPHLTLLRVICT